MWTGRSVRSPVRLAATPPPPVAAQPDESGAPIDASARSRWLKHALRGVILAMAGGAVVFAYSLSEDTWSHLRGFRWRFLPVLLGMVAVAWVCNGLRTWLLAGALGQRIRLKDAVKVTLSTEFAIAATPGGLGGVAMRTALQKRLGIAPAQTASMITADVAVDLAFFAMLWPFAAVAVHRLLVRSRVAETADHVLHSPAPWVVLAIGIALMALTVGLVRRYALKRGWWRRFLSGVRDFFGNLAKFAKHGKRRLLLCFLVGTVQWSCRYGVLPVSFLAFGVTVEVLPLMILQGVLFLLAMVVVLPGGGGSVELLSGVILPLIAPAAVVGPVVVVWRVLTYHLYVLGGGLVLWRVLGTTRHRAAFTQH